MPIRIPALAALLSCLCRFCPSAGAYGIKALDFPTPQVGYAVGRNGAILKTADAGGTWTLSHYDSIQTLYDVHFLNADTGFAAGLSTVSDTDGIYDPLILKTLDGGKIWAPNLLQGRGILASVHFASPDTGFAVGNGVIFRTLDKGLHWLRLDSSGYDQRSVRFTDPRNGFITGYQYFHETHDGGETWKLTTLRPLRVYSKVRFLDAKTGWRGGGYNIDRTLDGGKTWEEFTLPPSGGIVDFRFVSAEAGFYSSGNGVIGKTTDGGKTWRKIATGFGGNLDAVFFTGPGVGFAAGADGKILKTMDGGETWMLGYPASTGLAGRCPRSPAAKALPGRLRGTPRFLSGSGEAIRLYRADGRGLPDSPVLPVK
jgi:photosystem II stability/assembly factor-like uncharacterized protein